jgi:hypothetical protein
VKGPRRLFDFIEGTIRVLAGPHQSVDDLRQLRWIIEDARQKGADARQVAAAIETQVPALVPLIRQLLIPRNAGEFYAFLGFLISVILLVLALKDQPQPVNEYRH